LSGDGSESATVDVFCADLITAGNQNFDPPQLTAIVQLRSDAEGRRYCDRKLVAGKTRDGSDALPQTATVRRRPQSDARRRPTAGDGPGRTSRGG
jgi:hypothetical protein